MMQRHKRNILAGLIVLMSAIGFCAAVTIQMNKNADEPINNQSTVPRSNQTASNQPKQTSKVYTIDQLSSAVLSNDRDMVKEIINSQQVDINTKDSEGNYPLENVMIFENVEMAAFLLENGADPNLELKEGSTVAKEVVKSNNQAMKALFKNY